MPIEFRCTQCHKLLETPDGTAGQQAKCPECGTIQPIPTVGAGPAGPPPGVRQGSPFASGTPGPGPAMQVPSGAPPGTVNPYQSPSEYAVGPEAWLQPSYLHAYAADRVMGPANGLILTGSIGLALQTLGLTLRALSPVAPDPPEADILLAVPGWVRVALILLGFAISAVVIIGGLKMKRLDSSGWATAGAILAMLPCLSPCCLMGFPFGIWALVVLNDPTVKSAFRT